jgi:hypothetical protein
MRGLFVCTFISVMGLGCGGSSDEPPKPLSRHFDDMYIAAIPIDQQKPSLEAQHDWAIAKAENAKAESDYNEATTQLTIARNDVKATQLAVDSAVSTKQSADKSADMNKINNATKDVNTTQDLKKASIARVHYLEAYRNYLRRYWRYTQENMYWHEAQYEQAKSSLAKQNNIAPKGVSYEWFPSQAEQRNRRMQSAKQKTEGEKQRAVTARESWLKIQHQADVENGHETSLPDPMGPVTGPTTAGNVRTEPKVIEAPPTSNPTDTNPNSPQ